MKIDGHLPRHSFRAVLLLMLAMFGSSANAIEQGILPDATWQIVGWGGAIFNSPEEALAGRELSPPEKDFVECKHHQTGKWIRKPRPSGMPFPGAKAEACGEDCKDTAATVVVAGGTAYIVYRCVRTLPSLFPAAWPTMPANVVVP